MFGLVVCDKFLLLDKPLFISSFKFISPLKRLYRKVGHSGTLDPFATGLLVVALGRATKFLRFLPSYKEYFFSIQFGFRTDSDDLAGQIIAANSRVPSLADLLRVLPLFVGSIAQRPSKFSAIKINGYRAYALARSGLDFKVPIRNVFVYSLELLFFDGVVADFRVVCSKGFYVRALASDICSALSVFGCVVKLHRFASDGFSLLDGAEASLSCFLQIYPLFKLDMISLNLLKNGRKITCSFPDGVYSLVDDKGSFLGLGSVASRSLSSLCLV